MSWSISTEGSPGECIEAAQEKVAGLSDNYKAEAEQVIASADALLAQVPTDAKVILNLSGSHSEYEGKVSGSLGIGVSYQT